MKRRHVAIIIGAVVCYLLGAFLTGSDVSSSFSTKPTGNMAFFMLLEQHGLKPERWLYPFSELKPEKNATFFLINPVNISQEDRLIDWVSAGNTLVFFDGPRSPTSALLRKLHFWKPSKEEIAKGLITSKLESSSNTWSSVTCLEKFGPECQLVKGVSKLSPGLRVSAECDGVVSGSCDHSQIFRRSIGQGTAWIFANADIISNEHIDKFDNLRLLYQIAGKNKIYIDEFHHGYTAPVSEENKENLAVVKGLIGYLVIFLVIAAVSRSVRFGPPVKQINQDNSNVSDFVAALGILYHENESSEMLRYYVRNWKERVAKKYGFSPGSDDDTLYQELLSRTSLSDQQRKSVQNALSTKSIDSNAISQLESFL